MSGPPPVELVGLPYVPIRQVKIIDGRSLLLHPLRLLLLLGLRLAVSRATSTPLHGNPLGCPVRTAAVVVDDVSTAAGRICVAIPIPIPVMFACLCSHNHILYVELIPINIGNALHFINKYHVEVHEHTIGLNNCCSCSC